MGLGVAYKMHPFSIFICLSIGTMLGISFFTLFGVRIRQWRKARRLRKFQTLKAMATAALENQKFQSIDEAIPAKLQRSWKKMHKPLNIRKARRTKRLWSKVGIIGIALITPPMISPPVGALISVFFGERLKRIFLFMFLSAILWAAIFALLGHQILDLLHGSAA